MKLPDASAPLRIGTRDSRLALAQAFETRALLMAAHGLPEAAFEIAPIRTTADRIQDRALKDLGGKGLFTKELEDALLSGVIDIAVHCVKDMAVAEPEGLMTDCMMEREDPRDAFVSHGFESLAGLPPGAVVGTSSMRRRAQVLHRRPDLTVVNFRGNVQTRLRKLEEGVAAATFLAMAGLNRLGLQSIGRNPVGIADMLPAVGQGALAIQRRKADEDVARLIAPLHHPQTEIQMAAERMFLATLEGSCETPIAGYAEITPDGIRLMGEILRPDGSEVLTAERSGSAADAALIGRDLARELLARAPADFFDWRTSQPRR